MDRLEISDLAELALQVLYIDGRILVVCTGSSGETFSFIDKSECTSLLKKSISLHKKIDGMIEEGDPPITKRRRVTRDMDAFGQHIFGLVFKDQILDLLNVAIGQAIKSDQNVLLKLMVASDFLNVVPWELLNDKGTYLCHTYDLVRHPFALQPVRYPLATDESVRVLFVGANPTHNISIQGQIDAVLNIIDQRNGNV